MDGATFAKAMWLRHGVSPGQCHDLLRVLRNKGMVCLTGQGSGHTWDVVR